MTKNLLIFTFLFSVLPIFAQNSVHFEYNTAEIIENGSKINKSGWVNVTDSVITYHEDPNEVCHKSFDKTFTVLSKTQGIDNSTNYIVANDRFFIVYSDKILYCRKVGDNFIYEWLKKL